MVCGVVDSLWINSVHLTTPHTFIYHTSPFTTHLRVLGDLLELCCGPGIDNDNSSNNNDNNDNDNNNNDNDNRNNNKYDINGKNEYDNKNNDNNTNTLMVKQIE